MNALYAYESTSKGEVFSKKDFIDEISDDFQGKVDGYISTHGPTGAPVAIQVDMLKLKNKARLLLSDHFDDIIPSLSSFQQVTDSFLDPKEIEVTDLSTDVLNSLAKSPNQAKKQPIALVLSLDLMLLMIVIKSLADLVEDEDEVLSNSCHSLVGYLMMELADINDGEIPERFIKILKACGLTIRRLDEASIEDLKIEGLSIEELEKQREIRQGLMVEPSITTIH